MNREINQERHPEVEPQEEPLCVLKYVARPRIVFVAACLIIIPFSCLGVFIHSPTSMFSLIGSKLFGPILLLFFVVTLVDLALCKEIRLYKDRVAKTWAFLGTRELALDKAAIYVSPWGLGKALFHQGVKKYRWIWGLHPLWAICYREPFVKNTDRKRMDAALARVSGRDVKEFDETGFTDRFLKRGPMDDLPSVD